MYTRNLKGKSFLSLPAGAAPLSPLIIPSEAQESFIAAVTLQGRLLVFPLDELPELPKGKGNKMIHIPPKDIKEGKDRLLFFCLLGAENKLVIHAGKRFFAMTRGNLQDFMGGRGKRGKKLPRGLRNVTAVAVE